MFGRGVRESTFFNRRCFGQRRRFFQPLATGYRVSQRFLESLTHDLYINDTRVSLITVQLVGRYGYQEFILARSLSRPSERISV